MAQNTRFDRKHAITVSRVFAVVHFGAVEDGCLLAVVTCEQA